VPVLQVWSKQMLIPNYEIGPLWIRRDQKLCEV
jgi:hypothetical protein